MGDSDYELVYYWVEECAALFAYGSYYEFFERYDRTSDCWRPTISTAKKWTRARRK